MPSTDGYETAIAAAFLKALEDAQQSNQADASKYAAGFLAGFRQARAAVQRAEALGIPLAEVVTTLRQHEARLIPWRNAACQEPPPELRKWQARSPAKQRHSQQRLEAFIRRRQS